MSDDRRNDEDEERPKIKVIDRRKFAADGTLRPNEGVDETTTEATPSEDSGDPVPTQKSSPGPDEPAADAAPATSGEEATTPATAHETEDGSPAPATETAEPAAESAPPSDDADPSVGEEATVDESEDRAASESDDAPRISSPGGTFADLPRDFSAFIQSLYLEAMLYMGAIADPRTGQTTEDPELAKYKIDILGMLKEKTEGNLTPEEAHELDEMLYQARMVYVQRGMPQT